LEASSTNHPPVDARAGARFLARLRDAVGVSALVVLTLLASALNYASSIIFSRVLGPAGFGELTALLALAVIIAVPTAAAQTVIAERVAVHQGAGRVDTVRYLLRHATAHVAVIAAAVTAVYIVAIPAVIELFSLRAPGPAIALAPLIFLSFLAPVALGLLQGLGRFVAYGSLLIAISGARILFGVPWAWAGGGAGGAIGGQALGMIATLAVAGWLLRPMVLRRGSGAATSGLRRRLDIRAVSASAAFIAFAVISNLDVLLAKIFLDSHDVGQYAAIATVGKVVTFMPAAIAVVLVPNVARAGNDRQARARAIRRAAGLVVTTAALVAIPAALAPKLVVALMFGPGYEDAVAGVAPIVCAGAALALLYLLVVYAVTIEERRWVLVLALGVLLQVIGIGIWHGSPAQVAAVQACVCVLVLVVNEHAFLPILRGRTWRSGSPLRPDDVA
jgi:O-antigen/teichoic acid export membrane protein